MPFTYWFIGTPYSLYPEGLEAAFNLAVQTRGLLLKAGVPCFSPIAHSHPVALACELDPLDHNIWLPSERPLLEAASGLIVVKAASWEASKGLAYEIAAFRAAGKPVVYMVPWIVPEELRK